jgi:hypothetical protein
MKYGIRSVAAIFGLLGFTSTIGALLSGNDPAGSISLILIAVIALVIAHD